MEATSAGGSPFPKLNRPHARVAGREAFPPPSLPPRQWRENWVRSSLLLLAGGRGRGCTAVSPRPAGRVWGGGGGRRWTGTCGLSRPTPHPRVSELKDPGSAPLDAAQTCAHPGTTGTSPHEHPNSRGSVLRTPTFQALPSPLGIPNHICS